MTATGSLTQVRSGLTSAAKTSVGCRIGRGDVIRARVSRKVDRSVFLDLGPSAATRFGVADNRFNFSVRNLMVGDNVEAEVTALDLNAASTAALLMRLLDVVEMAGTANTLEEQPGVAPPIMVHDAVGEAVYHKGLTLYGVWEFEPHYLPGRLLAQSTLRLYRNKARQEDSIFLVAVNCGTEQDPVAVECDRALLRTLPGFWRLIQGRQAFQATGWLPVKPMRREGRTVLDPAAMAVAKNNPTQLLVFTGTKEGEMVSAIDYQAAGLLPIDRQSMSDITEAIAHGQLMFRLKMPDLDDSWTGWDLLRALSENYFTAEPV